MKMANFFVSESGGILGRKELIGWMRSYLSKNGANSVDRELEQQIIRKRSVLPFSVKAAYA